MDEIISERIGIKISNIKNLYKSCNKNLYGEDEAIFSKWQYSITEHFPLKYSVKTAQSLLEIIQYISWFNGYYITDKSIGNTFFYPKNFDTCIRVFAQNKSQSNIFFFLHSFALNMTIIVFSGTYDEDMAFINMNVTQEKFYPDTQDYYKKHIRLHSGYNKWYNLCKKNLYSLLDKYTNKDTQIIPCGISLGGSVSTVSALDLHENGYNNQILHYTFASPRLWNLQGAEYYNSYQIPSYRIYNTQDMVPKLPLNFMVNIFDPLLLEQKKLMIYMHVGYGIPFEYNLGSIIRNHGESYIKFFNIKNKSCVKGDKTGGY